MKVYTPFFTDSAKVSPITPVSKDTPKHRETSTSYIVDYGDDYQSSSPTSITAPVEKPAVASKPVYVSGIDVGNMQDVLSTLDKHGIKYRLTSGKRTKPIGKAGSKSHHLTGNAIDIVPTDGMSWDEFKKQFKNKEVLDYLKSKGYGILDETTPEALSKTGGTGAHFHIGPDRSARAGLNAFYAKYGMRFPKYAPGGNIEDIKKDMSKQYSKGSKKLEKLSKELSVIPESGERISQRIIDLLNSTPVKTTNQDILHDPNIRGAYNKITGDVIVKEDAGRGTIIHELAHATDSTLQEKRIKQLKNIFGNNIYKYKDQAPSDYLDSEEEIYARFKDTCDRLGIDLSKDYTDEELDKILLKASKGKTYRYLLEDQSGNKIVKTIQVDGDGNTTSTPTPIGAKLLETNTSQVFEDDKDFLNRYNPRFIKTMIKELVSIDSNNDNKLRV